MPGISLNPYKLTKATKAFGSNSFSLPPLLKRNIDISILQWGRGGQYHRIWVSILAQFPSFPAATATSLANYPFRKRSPILSGFHERLAANFTGELTCYPRATHLIFKRGFKRDSRFETEYLNTSGAFSYVESRLSE